MWTRSCWPTWNRTPGADMTFLILTLLLHLAEISECNASDERWTLFTGCIRNEEQVFGFNSMPSDVSLS